LKRKNRGYVGLGKTVAPFTGAWIETAKYEKAPRENIVAPFTGAWIETQSLGPLASSRWVAPFTGAWIETRTGLLGISS